MQALQHGLQQVDVGHDFHVFGSHVDAGEVHCQQPVAGGLALVQGCSHRLAQPAGVVRHISHKRSEIRAAQGSLQSSDLR